jgi:hypothetical protein
MPWPGLAIAAFLIGLAPFAPEPHLFEKLRMLTSGQLHTPLDMFDLILHASAPSLALIKLARTLIKAQHQSSHNQ